MDNINNAVKLSSVFANSIVAQDENKSNNEIIGGYQQDFEISRFSSLLQPTKEKDKHICPNCGGHNFSVGAKGYKCFNHECSVKLPLFRSSFEAYGFAKTDANPVILSSGKATYIYNDSNRVERFLDKKGKKACIPYEGGNKGKSSRWLPYRWELISSSDKWLLGCEGEKCVESLVRQGVKAITWCGAGKDWDYILEDARKLYQQGLHGFVYLMDNDDNPGRIKADKVVKAFRQAGIWVTVVNPAEYKSEYNRIDKFDIADLLEKEAWENVLGWLSSQVTLGFNAARQSSKNSKTSTRSSTTVTTTKEINWDEIQEKYINCKSDRDREVFKLAIAQQYNLSPYDVGRVLDSREEDDPSIIASEVARSLQHNEIDVSGFLPDFLATPIKEYAKFQKINEAVLLSTLLGTVSSLHKPGSQCHLHRGIGFSTVPTLFMGIIAESGSKKSPIFREIAQKPLSRLRRRDLSRYAQEMENFNKEDDSSKEPKIPAPYLVSSATSEGLQRLAADHPDKSILFAIDELAGLFGSLNQYKGGRGSDKQDLLSFYDGAGVSVARATGVERESEFLYLSILGTIQPQVLAGIIKNNQDADGTFARFLFCRQPNVATSLPQRGQSIHLADSLSEVYESIAGLPRLEMDLSDAAFDCYSKFYSDCEVKRVSADSPCERYFWGKAEGLAGRLAFNLQVLRNPVNPGNEISLLSMQNAIALVHFYHSELMSVLVSVDPESSISPHLSRMIKISLQRGWIGAREVYCSYSGKDRPKALDVQAWMKEAAKLGFGSLMGDGRNLKFKANDGNDGEMMVMPPSFQTLTQQEFQPNDGNDGNDGDFPEKNTHLKNLGVNDDRSALSLDGSPHPETLGDTFFEQNSHQRHHCHQTAETLTVQGQTMMAESPSISPSLQLDYFNSSLFEGADAMGDGYDWIDVDYWHQAKNPPLLAQTHHLGGVGSRCVYKNKVGTISCLTFDDDGLMRMFKVAWDDGSQIEPHPGECHPYLEDWMLE